jgi:DMSO/TMAO reductase YedYZ heme-binding membrane subunit
MQKNIRFYVLFVSFLVSISIYFWVITAYNSERLQLIRLNQIYALVAFVYLYIALLIGPLMYAFYSFPFKNQLVKSRRALGVCVFYFASLHSGIAFFGQLGGLTGLGFLDNNYLLAIVFSFVAYLILLALTLTSFDYFVAKMKFKNWKLLHRLVYLSAILILIHALMLGTHFIDLSALIPRIFAISAGLLLLLEANRLDVFLRQHFSKYPSFGMMLISASILVGAILTLTFGFDSQNTPSLGIHAQHIQLAKDAQNGTSNSTPAGGALNQALSGDRTKRYTVTYDHPESVNSATAAHLLFKVNDASSGNKVVLFNTIYEKKIHLIIVDSTLSFFDHVHPEATPDGFSIDYTFPQDGEYHLYIDFQPVGAIEQQFAFTQTVGNITKIASPPDNPDTRLSKQFGPYTVNLDFSKPLQSSKISIGGQKVAFTLKNTASGDPVTNLKPYLASFGHLVMINTKTFEYIHVHPTNLVAPKPTDLSGPTVEFLPLGIYGPIKPGTYKVFGQFNPAGELMVTDFIVNVE